MPRNGEFLFSIPSFFYRKNRCFDSRNDRLPKAASIWRKTGLQVSLGMSKSNALKGCNAKKPAIASVAPMPHSKKGRYRLRLVLLWDAKGANGAGRIKRMRSSRAARRMSIAHLCAYAPSKRCFYAVFLD